MRQGDRVRSVAAYNIPLNGVDEGGKEGLANDGLFDGKMLGKRFAFVYLYLAMLRLAAFTLFPGKLATALVFFLLVVERERLKDFTAEMIRN